MLYEARDVNRCVFDVTPSPTKLSSTRTQIVALFFSSAMRVIVSKNRETIWWGARMFTAHENEINGSKREKKRNIGVTCCETLKSHSNVHRLHSVHIWWLQVAHWQPDESMASIPNWIMYNLSHLKAHRITVLRCWSCTQPFFDCLGSAFTWAKLMECNNGHIHNHARTRPHSLDVCVCVRRAINYSCIACNQIPSTHFGIVSKPFSEFDVWSGWQRNPMTAKHTQHFKNS